MCGRYTLHMNKKKLAEAIALAVPETYEPNYNLGPGREVLSIVNDQESKSAKASMMHWGLRTPQNFHVNARIETADTSPRFRDSWENHRCLIPANGFYEWYADGITKQPYYIAPTDREISFLAGIWYPTPKEELAGTCIILTTEAHSSITRVHDRMPLLLPYAQRDAWIGNEMSKADAIELANLVPFEAHTASRRVNSVRNNDSELIETTSPQSDDQMMLF